MNNKLARLSIIIVVSFLAIFIALPSTYGAIMSVNPSSGTVYQSCYQPFEIRIDTQGTETTAIDAKFFLSGYFTRQQQSGHTDYIINSGVFQSNNWTTTLQTGTATSGNKLGRVYQYINPYTSVHANAISGSYTIITYYLKPGSQFSAGSTGYLDFYFLGSGINSDDSNITSGINKIGSQYSQFTDVLFAATGGVYTYSSANSCPYKPHILSGTYGQYTYVGTGIQVRTSVIAGPNRTQPADWNIWTNSGVVMTITGAQNGVIEPIQINWIAALDNLDGINLRSNAGWTNPRVFDITGNLFTGYVGFTNELNNLGTTYTTGGTHYTYNFNIDVFWLDTKDPSIATGFISGSSTASIVYFYLSGQAATGVSNTTSGRHANRTTNDDQFVITNFSGTNTTTYSYATITGYNVYLNDTGYINSGGLNQFAMTHTIPFTEPRSGTITIMDRAGNTGTYFLDASNVVPALDYRIYAAQGMYKLAIYSGTYDSGNTSNGVQYTGRIKTNSNGYIDLAGLNLGTFTGEIVLEPLEGLTTVITGVSFTLNGVVATGSLFTLGNMYPINTTATGGVSYRHASYAVKNGEIDISDLARMAVIMGLRPDYASSSISTDGTAIFSNTNALTTGLFSDVTNRTVDIPQSGSYVTYANRASYIPYHPYDINNDGNVNNSDYATLLTNRGSIEGLMPF